MFEMFGRKEKVAWTALLAVTGSMMMGAFGFVFQDMNRKDYIPSFTPVVHAQEMGRATANVNDEYDIRFNGVFSGSATAKVKVALNPDGTKTITFVGIDKSKPIYIGTFSPDDPGGPTDPVDPTQLEGIALAAYNAAKLVNDPQTAGELAGLWKAASQPETGDYQQAVAALKETQRVFLSVTGKTDKWKQWEATIDQELVRVAQESGLQKATLAKVAEGLAAASGSDSAAIFDGSGKWLPVILFVAQKLLSGEPWTVADFAELMKLIRPILTL